MPSHIDFYFDFSSPYGYLASERIEALAKAHNREVHWHPIVLGFIFKITGSQPLLNQPLKGDYARHDMYRAARQYNIPLVIPTNFPAGTVAASRAILWLQQQDQAKSVQLIHAIYRAYFADDRDISSTDVILDIAANNGVSAEALSAALQQTEVKALLKTATDDAVARGVFGSPYMIVDDEPFWGQDRMEMLELWLERGGW